MEKANSVGILLAYPANQAEKALGKHQGTTIELKLPSNMKTQDIGWLSVWCRKFSVNFGHVEFPNLSSQQALDVNPEPENGAPRALFSKAIVGIYLTLMSLAWL